MDINRDLEVAVVGAKTDEEEKEYEEEAKGDKDKEFFGVIGVAGAVKVEPRVVDDTRNWKIVNKAKKEITGNVVDLSPDGQEGRERPAAAADQQTAGIKGTIVQPPRRADTLLQIPENDPQHTRPRKRRRRSSLPSSSSTVSSSRGQRAPCCCW